MLKDTMSRNEGKEEKTGKFLQVFFSVEVFQTMVMQEQAAGEKRREGGHRRDAELWAISFLGQDIKKLIVAPMNLRWDLLAG